MSRPHFTFLDPPKGFFRTWFSLFFSPGRWLVTFSGLPFWSALLLGQLAAVVGATRGWSLYAALALGVGVHMAVFRFMVDAWLAELLDRKARERVQQALEDARKAQEPPDQAGGG